MELLICCAIVIFPWAALSLDRAYRIAIPKSVRQDILFLAVKGKSCRLEFVAFYTVDEVLPLAITPLLCLSMFSLAV